ncbi:MAG: glycosyltransferase family 4 protein [Lachnospiraceae bacterium]|nr:glycosyltransferase family 4 protein [Lachnospiraceae bacterium]
MGKKTEKRLRILQVHNYYRIAGGEEQVVKNEGNMLKNRGHKVWLYTRESKEISCMNLWEKLCLPLTSFFSIRTYRDVKLLIRENRIDLVHVHNTLPFISPSVFYAALTSHVPVVLTVHNFRLLCPNGVFYREGHICEECVKKGLLCSIKHGCYRDSRIQTLVCAAGIKLHRMLGTYGKLHYICLTEFNKKKLLQLKQIDEKKVFVKANFMNRTEEIKEVSHRKNRIIYAGRLEENKGIKLLLRAYKKLADDNRLKEEAVPELVICGEGSLQKQCEHYVKKHHLNKVSFAGKVDNDRVRQMMAEARGIVIPTLLYEGFPMNVAEGYSVRTPVIGPDRGNTGDLIKDHVNGLKFEAGNAGALAAAVMACDPESCSFDLPDAEEWTEEGNYRKLIEIYERCLEDVRKDKKA